MKWHGGYDGGSKHNDIFTGRWTPQRVGEGGRVDVMEVENMQLR